MNTTDPDQLAEARDMLIEQKPLVQAYVIDQVRDKMINGEAAAAMLYSGDLLYIQDTAKEQGSEFDLEYVLPEEGTSYWIDCWVIPANAEHKENAEKWINFLCRPDIAKRTLNTLPTLPLTRAPLSYWTRSCRITRLCSRIFPS